MGTYDLHEFKLPPNWTLHRNAFYAIDPDSSAPPADKWELIYSNEDLLIVSDGTYVLDLGWYGGDDGSYGIYFFRGNWLKGELLESHHSRSSVGVVARVKEILSAHSTGSFSNVVGYVVDEKDTTNNNAFTDMKELFLR